MCYYVATAYEAGESLNESKGEKSISFVMYIIILSIVVDSNFWWIKDLFLQELDRKAIEKGLDLSDNVINASLRLLKLQFPHISGFQNVLLGVDLSFRPMNTLPSIQILHAGIVGILSWI